MRGANEADDPEVHIGNIELSGEVEKAHSKLIFNAHVRQILGVMRARTRMDSEAKYCSLERGDGGVYFGMPVGFEYQKTIWVRVLAARARASDIFGADNSSHLGPRCKVDPR